MADIIVNPVNGEIVSTDDVDGMIGVYEDLDAIDKHIYAAKVRIRKALADLATQEEYRGKPTKTLRVEGAKRKAKLTLPTSTFNQSRLKWFWDMWGVKPEYRDRFLRIKEIGVDRKELDKLRTTAVIDNPQLADIRDSLLAAEINNTSAPTLTIET